MEFWQTLAAVIVGGLIAPVGNIVVGIWQSGRTRKSLENAIVAEVASTLEMVEKRGHVAHYQSFIDDWKRGHNLNSLPGIHGLDEGDEETSVFDSLVDRVGELDAETAKGIVQFVGITRGIRHDLRAISRGNVPDVQKRIQLLEEDIQLWRQAERIGRELIRRSQRS
jgi:hypothetical protein